MSADPRQIGRDVVAMCADLGFAGAGVAPAEPSDHARELREWLAAGKHGSMSWLERDPDQRADPRRVLPGARSVIMVTEQYATRNDPPDRRRPGFGRIARYARGRDYHKVLKKRLHTLCDALRERYPGETFRAFTDTAPVLEREHALRAGLGWIGKHTLLIDLKKGSYLLLGGVLTTLEVEPPESQRPVADHCGTCTRCIDACPTDAITPYSVDATRCISYLTIERREPTDPAFDGAVGDWVFGCDVCQEVCPHNGRRRLRADVGSVNPEYEAQRQGFDLLEVLGWSEEDRRAAFQGTALKRARLDMMKRNALIAAGNALEREDIPSLRAHLAEIGGDEDEPEMVRETARRTLARVGSATDGRIGSPPLEGEG